MFTINYFIEKHNNNNIETYIVRYKKSFSRLRIDDGDDDRCALLLKEGQTTFKFYVSRRTYCQWLFLTLDLKNCYNLIARIYNTIMHCNDHDIAFQVYMNHNTMEENPGINYKITTTKLKKKIPQIAFFILFYTICDSFFYNLWQLSILQKFSYSSGFNQILLWTKIWHIIHLRVKKQTKRIS